MSYRDDLEAAQGRIGSLERELEQTKKELASKALVVRKPSQIAKRPGQKAAKKWLGENTRFRGERTIDGEIDASTYADIVECLNEGFDLVGRSSIVPGRLDWVSAPTGNNNAVSQTSVSVTSGKGKTVIRGDIRLGGLAGAVFGGVGGGVGLGAVMAPGALFFLNPIAGVVGVAAWLGASYWTCRKIFTRSASKRAKRLEEVLDELEAIVKTAAKPADD